MLVQDEKLALMTSHPRHLECSRKTADAIALTTLGFCKQQQNIEGHQQRQVYCEYVKELSSCVNAILIFLSMTIKSLHVKMFRANVMLVLGAYFSLIDWSLSKYHVSVFLEMRISECLAPAKSRYSFETGKCLTGNLLLQLIVLWLGRLTPGSRLIMKVILGLGMRTFTS